MFRPKIFENYFSNLQYNGLHDAPERQWIMFHFVQTVRAELPLITEPDLGVLTYPMTYDLLMAL